MAGLLSVPATRGDRSEAGRREGRKGRGGRAGGERRAKEGRRNGGEGAGPRGSGCEVRPRFGAETSGWRPGGVPEGCGSGARRERAVCRPPADQPGPGRTRAPGALSVTASGALAGPRPRVSARAPGVWPCARPCALARSPRERLHGCCVGRPAALDAAGWGNTVASFPAGGGPVRGADRASRTRRGAGADPAATGSKSDGRARDGAWKGYAARPGATGDEPVPTRP